MRVLEFQVLSATFIESRISSSNACPRAIRSAIDGADRQDRGSRSRILARAALTKRLPDRFAAACGIPLRAAEMAASPAERAVKNESIVRDRSGSLSHTA